MHITAIETELKKQFQELFDTRELAPHLMEIVQNVDTSYIYKKDIVLKTEEVKY